MKNNLKPYAPVIIYLLKGVLYAENSDAWNLLLNYESDIRKHFESFGISLFLDHAEGYAFLQQKDGEEDEEETENQRISLPSLIEKRPLSYPVTLLCVLLRKKLLEEDAKGGETRVVLSREEMVEMIRIFLPEHSNEAKIIDSIDSYITRIVNYGFLRKLKNEEGKFEINRIIKAKITADVLRDIEQKLKEYAKPD